MPRLTVLMPAKDAEQTIGQALSSTLNALPRDAEILVWNDGSTDRTSDEVAKLRDPRVKETNSSQSLGSGAGRRMLLNASDSEFVACMDADDLCYPWRFRAQRRSMRDADFSFASMVRFSRRPFRVRPAIPFRYGAAESRVALAIHNPFAQSTLFARRSALVDAGGWSDIRYGQDYEFWLRAAAREFPISKLAIPVIGYRVSPEQATQRPGYHEYITTNPLIGKSFNALVGSLTSDGGVDLDTFVDHLRAYVERWDDPILRRYYGKLLHRERPVLLADMLASGPR